MNKSLLLIVLLLCMVAGAPFGSAQTAAGDTPPPPNVLWIEREEIKPGMGPAHDEETYRFIRVMRKAKSPWGRIGLKPITGDKNAVIYLWPFDSFADREKFYWELLKWAAGPFQADFALIKPGPDYKELHDSQHDMLSIFRPDLSYRPNVNIAEMRYAIIERLQVKPGQQRAFSAGAGEYIETLKKASVDSHSIVFQVVSGAESGLFLIISPMKSLSELDQLPARMRAFSNALGPEGMKKHEKLISEVFASISSGIFVFDPKISHVSDEFAARDKSTPGFWNPRLD